MTANGTRPRSGGGIVKGQRPRAGGAHRGQAGRGANHGIHGAPGVDYDETLKTVRSSTPGLFRDRRMRSEVEGAKKVGRHGAGADRRKQFSRAI